MFVKSFLSLQTKPPAIRLLYSRGQGGHLVPRPPKNVSFSKKDAGERIRHIRESRDVTQVQLAKILGITQSNVSEMERGVRGITTHQVVRLAKALRVSIDEILVGGSATREKLPLGRVKLLRRVQRIERLPEPRQRVVLKFIDALIDQEHHVR
jgi:transcriptional regulator with XRE-family HTH domain